MTAHVNPDALVDYSIPPEHGPVYPNLTGMTKYRRRAEPTPAERREHGLAVLSRINALNRAKLNAALPRGEKCPCASGTWLSDGNAILAAIRRQHAAR